MKRQGNWGTLLATRQWGPEAQQCTLADVDGSSLSPFRLEMAAAPGAQSLDWETWALLFLTKRSCEVRSFGHWKLLNIGVICYSTLDNQYSVLFKNKNSQNTLLVRIKRIWIIWHSFLEKWVFLFFKNDLLASDKPLDHFLVCSFLLKKFSMYWFLVCILTGEGNGNPLQYSCLENAMDGGAWWSTVHGVAKSQTWLSNFPSLCILT